MEKDNFSFNRTAQSLVKDTDSDELVEPSKFFTQAMNELQERYNILQSSKQLNEAKSHLLTIVKTTSRLTEDEQDYYANRVNNLRGIVQLLMFLHQEIKGL